MRLSIPFIIDFTTFQLVWFACVLSSQSPYPSTLPLIGVALACFRIFPTQGLRPGLEMGLICLAMGLLGDGFLVRSGMISFANSPTILEAPYWMLCLWFAFGLFLKRLFRWFVESYARALSGFSVGGICAYSGGAGLGALKIEREEISLLAIGVEWAFAGLVLCFAWKRYLPAPRTSITNDKD